MNNKPAISVIMPVYNGEKYLKEALDSVISQTFEDFELRIINDCSTDNSLNIIKEYNDERIKIINNEKNVGFIEALNLGIKEAKGKYLAFFNQDDWNFPNRFEKQFNYLESHPEIFLVGSSAVYIDEDGAEIRRFRKFDDYKIIAWRLRNSNCIIHPSTMMRNKKVSFDDHFEYNLYYKLIKRGENLTNLPDFLILFRVHSESMSTVDKERQDRLRKETEAKFKELKDETGFFDKIRYSTKLFFHGLKTMNEKRVK